MEISKKTKPYSLGECKWDKDAGEWLFPWGEEIPPEWVEFSIKYQIPVEDINRAHDFDPNNFELNLRVINEILDNQ